MCGRGIEESAEGGWKKFEILMINPNTVFLFFLPLFSCRGYPVYP